MIRLYWNCNNNWHQDLPHWKQQIIVQPTPDASEVDVKFLPEPKYIMRDPTFWSNCFLIYAPAIKINIFCNLNQHHFK